MGNVSKVSHSRVDITVYKKASFFQRFDAFIIDAIIVAFGVVVLEELLQLLNIQLPFLQYIIPPLYGAVFIWKFGATPGKMLFKLKVVNTSYHSLGFGPALLRESIGKWVSSILFFGFLWSLIDKKNQTLYDKITHTFVVKLNSAGDFISTRPDVVTWKRKTAFWLLLLAFPLLFINYLFLFRPVQISGNAMNPNYVNGQYYITNIQYGSLNKEDVVVFGYPNKRDKSYIKRVIGFPGDTLMISNGNVYVNNQLLDESEYIGAEIRTYGGTFLKEGQSITVPEGSYFVMGDNRLESKDSRELGFVPKENIVGKVTLCYWKCSLSVRKATQ